MTQGLLERIIQEKETHGIGTTAAYEYLKVMSHYQYLNDKISHQLEKSGTRVNVTSEDMEVIAYCFQQQLFACFDNLEHTKNPLVIAFQRGNFPEYHAIKQFVRDPAQRRDLAKMYEDLVFSYLGIAVQTPNITHPKFTLITDVTRAYFKGTRVNSGAWDDFMVLRPHCNDIILLLYGKIGDGFSDFVLKDEKVLSLYDRAVLDETLTHQPVQRHIALQYLRAEHVIGVPIEEQIANKTYTLNCKQLFHRAPAETKPQLTQRMALNDPVEPWEYGQLGIRDPVEPETLIRVILRGEATSEQKQDYLSARERYLCEALERNEKWLIRKLSM